jgi:hypothetical protein
MDDRTGICTSTRWYRRGTPVTNKYVSGSQQTALPSGLFIQPFSHSFTQTLEACSCSVIHDSSPCAACAFFGEVRSARLLILHLSKG